MLGTTTIDEIQAEYGKAPILRSGREDESPLRVCYSNTFSKGKAFIVFESGAMGGFERVTGFRITTRYPRQQCPITKVSISSLTSGNGVRLLQLHKEFLEKFRIEFKQKEEQLWYEGESKREATKEELDRIRSMWPNEKQTFFDVIINIKADFKKDKLVDYSVSKVESY